MRVRNALCKATHEFFQCNGFYYIQTPIISGSDCEGAGQLFQVTTLLNEENINENSTIEVNYGKDFFERPVYLTVSGTVLQIKSGFANTLPKVNLMQKPMHVLWEESTHSDRLLELRIPTHLVTWRNFGCSSRKWLFVI